MMDSIRLVDICHSYPEGKTRRPVLHDVTLDLPLGQITGLVGESGCGKSTLGRICVGLTRADQGSVLLPDGTDINNATARQVKAVRPRLQMIVQNPYTSFDPHHLIADGFRYHARRYARATDPEDRIVSALRAVRLDPDLLNRRPHELSGGQLQRAAIARALVVLPQLLVADEIISALDLPIQDEVLTTLSSIEVHWPCAIVFISHDLGAVAQICSRLAVMDNGRIVEAGPLAQVLEQRRTPATARLLDAVPRFELLASDTCHNEERSPKE